MMMMMKLKTKSPFQTRSAQNSKLSRKSVSSLSTNFFFSSSCPYSPDGKMLIMTMG